MADTINLYAESQRNIIGDDNSPTLELENASASPDANAVALNAVHTGAGGGTATVAAVSALNSTVSGPALEFKGGSVISTASGGATLAFGVRVKFGDVYGWVNAYTEIDA